MLQCTVLVPVLLEDSGLGMLECIRVYSNLSQDAEVRKLIREKKSERGYCNVVTVRMCCYCMVPLNYNFIFTCVISHGTTRILQCIPVTCLRGPRLLVACNVHVSWKYTRGSTRVKILAWKYTRGNFHAWHVKFYSPSLELYINWLVNSTPVFSCKQHQYSLG